MKQPQEYHYYISAAIMTGMQASEATKQAVMEGVERFNAGDWGNIPAEDKAANNSDLQAHSGRIIVRYPTPEKDFYIIREMSGNASERDRVTVIYCEEY